ncbi:hypothetical protein [Nocardioides cavernaquae]|uniref:Sulfotransferase family protein n=1 Tax=Nocardioides cavernaquae TaxID=2321396 RepID=A0A3A5H891_9ACTN|nr:hypothetical protein [Nocardioides cavernaquae]RJS46652.1 hypothetical protein D4739_10770 [Nocardioides cavernaquae]
MSAMSGTPGRALFLHIGLQKTGTSYLQSIFWQSKQELARQGLDMVPGSKRDTFHLMLRARDRYRPAVDPHSVEGALDRLPQQLADAPGDRALITEESFAPAPPEQIERLLAHCGDREVHLVVTLRDLGRQIPSAWQQDIQSGAYLSYPDYFRRMRETADDPLGRFWSSKDVPAILERWGAHIPPERIHVVTVPPPGSDPELLLHRFCEVLGVDHATLDKEVARSNRGIGRVQVEVLRRVNRQLAPENRRRDVFGEVGKRYFAVQVLGSQRGEKILVPEEEAAWVRDLSTRYSAAIRAGGYHVVGDLADLDPAPEAFVQGSDEVSAEDVLTASSEALAFMLAERMETVRERRAAATAADQQVPSSRWARVLRR